MEGRTHIETELRIPSDIKEIERELFLLNMEYLSLKDREQRQLRLDSLVFFMVICMLALGLGLLILIVLMPDKCVLDRNMLRTIHNVGICGSSLCVGLYPHMMLSPATGIASYATGRSLLSQRMEAL